VGSFSFGVRGYFVMAINYIKASVVLTAASNPVRLRILAALCEQDMTVIQLEGIIGLAQSPLSQHLKRLRDAGLVEYRRSGRNLIYSVIPGMAEKLVLFANRNFQHSEEM
jgi:ArsR family transcriptional regulator, virulence genes transcriptional regulator